MIWPVAVPHDGRAELHRRCAEHDILHHIAVASDAADAGQRDVHVAGDFRELAHDDRADGRAV